MLRTITAKPFNKVLVANRGEIACRIIRTCQALDIETVSIFSNADRNSKHAAMADESYCIGHGPTPKESYLLMEEVLEIARSSGAQAVHPGYGFLSENAIFAEMCSKTPALDAASGNIKFIGPSASAISAMGSKSRSKEIMLEADVPCVPGYHGENQEELFLFEETRDKIGFPCLIKAVMGGGGKGMRIVRSEHDFSDALESCRRESLNAFGDDRVIIERYLPEPRHVEVQVFGDSYGDAVHLFERDCSVQRRHQKVLEEAPAPNLDGHLRNKFGEVAVRAAKAINYVGAGTVEFLLDNVTNQFYFCEMNTRLQVEHPVTELVTGLDLVEWQLRIAAGEKLPLNQSDIQTKGHAIEARIYAENPLNNFLPAAGTIVHHQPPINPNIRVESGVKEGDTIGVYYDPLISKLIGYGPDRESAINNLLKGLRSYQVAGLPNNISFVEKCASSLDFRRGGVTTKFLEQHGDAILEKQLSYPCKESQAISILALLLTVENKVGVDVNTVKKLHGPWSSIGGSSFRVGYEPKRHLRMKLLKNVDTSNIVSIDVICKRDHSYSMVIDDVDIFVKGAFSKEGQLIGVVNNKKFSLYGHVENKDDTWKVNLWSKDGVVPIGGDNFYSSIEFPPFEMQSEIENDTSSDGKVRAPMTGKVSRINVVKGDKVTKGDTLVVLEAMKMEHPVLSPITGIVAEILCHSGDVVDDSKKLVTITI